MPTIFAGGYNYSYDLFAAPQPQAIVLGFHGWAQSPQQFEGMTGLHLHGVPAVFAFPQGKSRWSVFWWFPSWNYNPGSEDVALANALIARLRQQYGPLPVYVVGHSEGASMAYRVACESDVAKLAAVSAGLNPVQAVRVPAAALHIHGDNDPIVPFSTYQPPVSAGITLLRNRGCPTELQLVAGGHDWNSLSIDVTDTILRSWGLLL